EAEQYPEDGSGVSLPAGKIRRFYEEQFESLGLQNASFSYQNADRDGPGAQETHVIDHLDLEIRKGEYAAFTGRSGCGKSTLFKLLMCLYPLNAGSRYLRARRNGKTEEYPLTALWRGLFAYVPQGNQLMSGTIREVVAFGDPRSEEHTSELQSRFDLVCRLLIDKIIDFYMCMTILLMI